MHVSDILSIFISSRTSSLGLATDGKKRRLGIIADFTIIQRSPVQRLWLKATTTRFHEQK
jgi:hypothetical protein